MYLAEIGGKFETLLYAWFIGKNGTNYECNAGAG